MNCDVLWDEYLDYLVDLCKLNKYEKIYSRLFDILHHKDFYFFIERDDNRQWDGMKYRDWFFENRVFDKKLEREFMKQRCSVMEMLVGLSIRVEGDYIGDPGDRHPEEFFMEMIENLGLDRFTNDSNMRISTVDKILNKWLDRDFARNGKGSIFPVKFDKRDQRELEIWDQMMSYINENYD